MSCSYEQYVDQLQPAKFYGAGLMNGWTKVYFASSAALAPLLGSSSPEWRFMGYVGAGLILLASFVHLRRSSLKHWSTAERPLRSLGQRNAVVEEVRVSALLAHFDPDPDVALRGILIDLEPAEKELQERKGKKEVFPQWYGSVLLVLLSAGLNMVPKPGKGLDVLGKIALAATALVVLKQVLDLVLEGPKTNFAGYVALLRRAKRRVEHEALKRRR